MNTHISSNRGRKQAAKLLEWYDAHYRDLPWRVPPAHLTEGIAPDPYRVWLSEVMLQQTTVEAVKPYFASFVSRWPTVTDLAEADQDDIMKEWAGLGYYSRARNLVKCARAVANEHDGVFPSSENELLALPGIGPYTAAAISAIAFNKPAIVIDGNIERVTSRLYAIETPLPAAKAEIRHYLSLMLPLSRPGDFAQAMMDLGASLCSPKRPKCMLCPVNEDCQALVSGDPEHFPVKAPRKPKPSRVGAAFVAVRADGAVLLRKRPESGLLGGMSEPPTTGWTARQDGDDSVDAAPFAAAWQAAGSVRHVFTHFELNLSVYRADHVSHIAPDGWWWSPRQALMSEALPTVMKKALESAIPDITKKRSTKK